MLAKHPRRPLPLPPYTTKQTCTTKQIGDAAEYLIAGLMTLQGGAPTFVIADNWPDFDLIAQPPDRGPLQRVNVKSVREKSTLPGVVLKPGNWHWVAFAWIPEVGQPRFWLIPRHVFDKKVGQKGQWRVSYKRATVEFVRFKDNFGLCLTGLVMTQGKADHASHYLSAYGPSSAMMRAAARASIFRAPGVRLDRRYDISAAQRVLTG